MIRKQVMGMGWNRKRTKTICGFCGNFFATGGGCTVRDKGFPWAHKTCKSFETKAEVSARWEKQRQAGEQ